MKNFEQRLKKIEETLLKGPDDKCLIFINYTTDKKEGWITINGKSYPTPKGCDVKKFAEDEVAKIQGNIVCIAIYKSEENFK